MPYSVELVASVKQGVDHSLLHTKENGYFCGKRDCPCFVELQKAWDELQAVPSYVEQQARAWSHELELEVE